MNNEYLEVQVYKTVIIHMEWDINAGEETAYFRATSSSGYKLHGSVILEDLASHFYWVVEIYESSTNKMIAEEYKPDKQSLRSVIEGINKQVSLHIRLLEADQWKEFMDGVKYRRSRAKSR